MTQDEIAEIVDTLSNVFNAKDVVLRGFIWALEDLPADAVTQAAREMVKTSKWMPKPSELRRAAEIKAQQHATHGTDYWGAMSHYNDALAGRMPWEVAEKQPEYKWFWRQTRPGVHVEVAE
jgi:hypothetical protein